MLAPSGPARFLRAALALTVVAALVSACSSGGGTPPAPHSAAAGARCPGLLAAKTFGRQPTWLKAAPMRFGADAAVCATYWIAQQQGGFVPQSLEVSGRTAYVGGYGPSHLRGLGHCQIAVVDLRTGRTTAFQDGIVLRGRYPHWVRCDHGGGMALSAEGLWLTQRHRIWLLDPAGLGTGRSPVVRSWTLPAVMRASTLLVHAGRLALASFDPDAGGRIWSFDLRAVLAPGTTRLTHPVEVADAPRKLQGITGVGDDVWFNSSTTRCGALRPGTADPVAFVPGSEDVEVVGNDLWTVSEAGSKRYYAAGDQAVPGLLRLDRSTVLAGPDAGCGF